MHTKHIPSTAFYKPWSLLAAMLFFAFGGIQAQEKPDLDWLLGTWHIPQMNVYETWEEAENGAGYEGRSVYRRAEGERLFENFRVHLQEGQWTLTVEMPGQDAVDFALVESASRKVVFENPEHDLPRSITYSVENGQVKARLLGKEGEQDIDYAMDLIPESGAAADAVAASNAYAHVSIGTFEMRANAEFYEALGFKMVAQDNAPWPWVMLSDGTVNIQLNQDGMQYFGLSYFGAEAVKPRLEAATAAGVVPFMEQTVPIPTTIYVDPDSTFGFGFLSMDLPFSMPSKDGEGQMGKLGEIAIPVAHYDSAKAWYGMMGFKSTGDHKAPYPWGIVTDGIVKLGLHQSPHFDKPALTYFSKNAAERIAALQEGGMEVKNAIPGTEKKETIQNGIVYSPDGWPVFIFQGDF